ncbi:MAG TPA: hypothetical protein VI522_08125, partial [Gammaproteobacteria bacterium]|nr:hypothetical protein [Gammaproteobacteria bacterium]
LSLQDYNLNVDFTAKPKPTTNPGAPDDPDDPVKNNSLYSTQDLFKTLIGLGVGLPLTFFITYLGYLKLDTDRQNIDLFANLIVCAGKINIHTFNADEGQDSFRTFVQKLLKTLHLQAEVVALTQQYTGKLECSREERSKAETTLTKYAEIIATQLKVHGLIAEHGVGKLATVLPNFAFKRLVGLPMDVKKASKVLPSETEIDSVKANSSTLVGAIHKEIEAYKNKPKSTGLLRAFTQASLNTSSSSLTTPDRRDSSGMSTGAGSSSQRSSPEKGMEMKTLEEGGEGGNEPPKSKTCFVM